MRTDVQKRKILAVCGRNKKRSLTAETIFKGHPTISMRSAGVSPAARHVATQADVAWADEIWCMEQKHQERLRLLFPTLKVPVRVLDIPDEYEYMDDELVEILLLLSK